MKPQANPLKFKTLNVACGMFSGAVEPWTPKPIPKFKSPKRGVWYEFEGAPIPKLWEFGQTKAPVGDYSYSLLLLTSYFLCSYSRSWHETATDSEIANSSTNFMTWIQLT